MIKCWGCGIFALGHNSVGRNPLDKIYFGLFYTGVKISQRVARGKHQATQGISEDYIVQQLGQKCRGGEYGAYLGITQAENQRDLPK